MSSRKTIKRIYIIFYEPQDLYGNEVNIPIKAFKNKKSAEIYANSRNFEFQTVCLMDEEDYEQYVISDEYADYIVTISDLKSAFIYFKDEFIKKDKLKQIESIWESVLDIRPFKVRSIELVDNIRS